MKIDNSRSSTTLLLEKLKTSARLKRQKNAEESTSGKPAHRVNDIQAKVASKILELHQQGANLDTLKEAFVKIVLVSEFDDKIPTEKLWAMTQSAITSFNSNEKLNKGLENLLNQLTSDHPSK